MIKGRPKKQRYILDQPRIKYFSPRGLPGRPEEVILTLDQWQASKLADYQGLNQKESAQIMRISQQTFSRILRQARRIVADALTNGKIIKISP